MDQNMAGGNIENGSVYSGKNKTVSGHSLPTVFFGGVLSSLSGIKIRDGIERRRNLCG